ncbi:hypothetical protein TNCV_1908741 [Trichonephila clavipes]|nr:hypothetical protein TNCV_1908741 [Trichonephila clavipes]
MTTCIPGNALQQFQVKKKQDLLHMEFYHHLPSWAMNEQMSYFSSYSDEWSRDLKSVQVQKQCSCRGGACKEPLPAPGNRSNERRYRGKDLATREEKSSERERRGWRRKPGS